MAFEIPAPQAPLDARALVQDLEKPVRLKNAPATNILRKHIEAQYAWLKQQRPTWSDAQIAYTLADANRDLLEGSAYGEITETAQWSKRKQDFIPWTEVAHGPKEATELLGDSKKYNTYKAELKHVMEQVHRASQQDPRYKAENESASWEYVIHSRDPQRPKEQLAMRVYLNPRLEKTPAVFAALLQELPSDAYYHLKTNDMKFESGAPDAAVTLTSRTDKIILYTTKDDAAQVLNAVERVQRRFAADLQGRDISSGSAFRFADGIGIGRETPDGVESASEIIAKRLSRVSTHNCAQLLIRELRKATSYESAKQSPAGQLLYASIMDVDPQTGTTRNIVNTRMLGLPKSALDTLDKQPQLVQQFSQALDLAAYSTVVQHVCIQEFTSKTALDQYFMSKLQEHLRAAWGGNHPELQHLLVQSKSQFPPISTAVVRAGFALGMHTALKAVPNTSPDFALPELLELPPNPEAQRFMTRLNLPQAPSP